MARWMILNYKVTSQSEPEVTVNVWQQQGSHRRGVRRPEGQGQQEPPKSCAAALPLLPVNSRRSAAATYSRTPPRTAAAQPLTLSPRRPPHHCLFPVPAAATGRRLTTARVHRAPQGPKHAVIDSRARWKK